MKDPVLYFIPGLGFDHRIFQHLELPGYTCHYLDWIEPVKGESIEHYASRLSEPIDSTSQKVVLIGHSLGGILSQQIALQKKIDRIILLSSIRSRKELPWFFCMIQPLGIHHLFTKKLTFSTFPLWAKTHGYVTKEEQLLFEAMVSQQSNHYLQWALRTLSAWQGVDPMDTPIIQIHGEKDKTFPIKYLEHPDVLVKDGGHFMVYNQSKKVSELLLKNLAIF